MQRDSTDLTTVGPLEKVDRLYVESVCFLLWLPEVGRESRRPMPMRLTSAFRDGHVG